MMKNLGDIDSEVVPEVVTIDGPFGPIEQHDGSVGGEESTQATLNGGQGPTNTFNLITKRAKTVPNGGAILSSDA